MNVILRTVYLIQNTVPLFDNAPDITVEIFVHRFRQGVFVFVGTEHDVIEDLPVTVHGWLFFGERLRRSVTLGYVLFPRMNPRVIHGQCLRH